ncbi:MAG TPA: metallophosphoesterase [Phycisphaerae bacterium]|nr:metallophosphoesterase [Phycisphaerae bacterium]
MILSDTPTFIFWASMLVDAVVAGAVLFRPWRRAGEGDGPVAIRLSDVFVTAVVTGAVFVGKWLVLQSWGFRFFGLIHLVYLDIVVLMPAMGVGVLLAGRRRWGRGPWRRVLGPVRALACVCVALGPAGVYATYIEPFRLQLETARIAVPVEREGSGPIRIGVLSDIQTAQVTDYERTAVARLMALAPDVILMPGDLFQGSDEMFERELPALRDLLSRLSAPGGVYFVQGDVDGLERVERVLDGTQVRLLYNEVVHGEVGDRWLTIGGVQLAHRREAARRVVGELEWAPWTADIRILLSHAPDVMLGLAPDSRIDLVVAGHTHGGQVQIPFFGPPFIASDVPREVGAGGYHELDGRRVYVSRGVGCERGHASRVRFGARPEISLLTLGDP